MFLGLELLLTLKYFKAHCTDMLRVCIQTFEVFSKQFADSNIHTFLPWRAVYIYTCTLVRNNMQTDSRIRTVCTRGSVDRVEHADRGDEAYVGLQPVVRVVSRSASHQVRHRRVQAELVEQARNAGSRHAPPRVVVARKHAGDDRDLRVGCHHWCFVF